MVRQFTLTVQAGADSGTTYQSSGEHVVVGTHRSCDLVLTDKAVSRFHCAIRLSSAGVELEDLGSSNGTTVDRVQVVKARLHSGAVLSIGRTQLRFDLGTTHVEIPISSRDRFGPLVGGSVAMRAVFHVLERAAASDATLLVEGPTGTGKELVAEAVHQASARRDRPFVTVDCAAMPPGLLESELFGHERGAFTGADSAREGAFERAAGGTIFLDEIGEIGRELQPKLLRVLEAREIKRVGGSGYEPVDVRVIAATNRDLRAEVNAQEFRADLFFRLAVLSVRLPSLRARIDDLPLLVETIVERFGAAGTEAASSLTRPEVYAELALHAWPGNVRELRNYIERALALGHLAAPGHGRSLAGVSAGEERPSLREARAMFERGYLEGLVRDLGGNMSAAARAAGVERMYLYRLLRKHGLR